MKRILLTICAITLLCTSAYCWGRKEHAAVAKIAERHLTEKAKKHLYKYMHRRSIVYYSCYADDYQPLYIDLGWEPSNYRRMAMFPHTYCVDENYKPPRSNRDGDKYIKNCLYYIDAWAKELKENHAKMNDSVRLTHLALIVHAVGDMHCPVHIRLHDDTTLGIYKVMYGNKKTDFHRLWDAGLVGATHPWSYTDMAALFDIYNKREIAKFCKGDIFEWGKEVAIVSFPMREYREGAKIDEIAYRHRYQQVGEELLTKAGYRLAKVLNEILK